MMSSRQYVPSSHKRRNTRIAIVGLVLVLIFAVPFVRTGVRRVVSAIGLGIGRGTHWVGRQFSSVGTAVRSKYSLEAENQSLKTQIDELNTRLVNVMALSSENTELKAAMGRSENAHFTLATVVEKPPHSVYDTLVIDGGSKIGFAAGQVVFANGETPIGEIYEVLPRSAIVRLYSAPGQSYEARLSPSNLDVTLTGRGGGNFSATIPHDVKVADGTVVVTKEIHPYTVAVYKKITSDPRDPFQTLLLSAPVNINELSFVEVREMQ